MVHLFIALVIIEIYFDLYLSIGSESIETQMYTFVSTKVNASLNIYIFCFKVKCSMCDAIYICNTQQTFKTIMHGHFSDLLRLFKNGPNKTHLLPTSNSTLSHILT